MLKDIVTIGGLTIHGYGLMIAIGFLLAVLVAMYRAKRYGLEQEIIIDIALIAIIGGFIGAKLLFVIVSFKDFLENPLEVLGSEGFVVYGGIISGVLLCMFYCIHKKVRFSSYFDIVMPSISIAQGFGRIGCFMAGCCYGSETDCFLGVEFPANSMAPTGVKLLPTQLFSAAGDFVIAGVLILFAKKAKYKGDTAAMYLALYGIGRFLIEFLRDDERGAVGFLSTSQFISIFFVIIAVILFIANKKKGLPADRIVEKTME
ncbi:prolipoprotein diacylglyceryl transferase [Anaerosporobacter faecicola]|uniref:prolipoprotein diacylglyceryl transferase n=1 Tax=Anaerosporobacter faecicola TaxID=2718714 RepID=UPI00143C0B99|nr:prolipoprotein diacylglyceryl transferase [Anaerosporobacter faecicola]